MKKIILLSVALTYATMCVASDSTTVWVWPDLGISFSAIQGKYTFPEGALYAKHPFERFSSLGVGLFTRMNLGNKAWFSPELMFYARRFKSDYEYEYNMAFNPGVLIVNGKQWKADAILLFGYGFMPNDAVFQPFISGGLCLGFNMNRSINQDWKTMDGVKAMDIQIREIDAGLVFGVGAAVKIGKTLRWSVEIRYSNSGTNLRYVENDRTNMNVQRVVTRVGISKDF